MGLTERFREAITIRTDWPAGAQAGDKEAEAPLIRFQEFLVREYPLFHKNAERRALDPYGVIYHWPGQRPRGKPLLFLAHYDVVPAEAGHWDAGPFDAELRDGYIYGRGTLDMKGSLVALMEAAEALCAQGFRPQEDIWFAFGGDEERAGVLGARRSAAWFEGQGIRFDWILDEGPVIGDGQIEGVKGPVAFFGIEEKGFLSLELTVKQQPGHASRPPRIQAAAVLAKALLRLSGRPFPRRLTPTMESFLSRLAPLVPGFRGRMFNYSRLLGPLFFPFCEKDPLFAAMFRTTVAITQLAGSAADNVLPSAVKAVVNIRLLPPWNVETASAFARRVIGDKRVEIAVYGLGTDAVAATGEQIRLAGPGWTDLKAALESAESGCPALPFLMTATTDSRHYQKICGAIFRFSPFRLNPRELAAIHGHNERVSPENLDRAERFYKALLSRL
ncbi:MAG: M20/M25/M40 family metallo-hydrolase [Treponema sp.]|jgi:carboxypeptidase PM20D1|nr:M20/M25/M40 family metallo-hydrolase [Treponema sp.]